MSSHQLELCPPSCTAPHGRARHLPAKADRPVRGLTPAQNDRVREALHYLVEHRYGSASVLATALERSITAVNFLLHGRITRGRQKQSPEASEETARRVATLMAVPVDLLLNSTIPIAELERSAARAPALVAVLHRLHGLLPPSVERNLRADGFSEGEKRSEIEWVCLAVDLLREEQRGGPIPTLSEAQMTQKIDASRRAR